MKHFRTMLVGLGIGLGGVALGSLPGQPTLRADGERHTVPVAVENTPTVNVRTLPAITGTVSITGQPVSVNVNTLPAVQLAPGTTVGVTGGNFSFSNTASTPIFTRDKDNPALAPFQITLCKGLTNIPNVDLGCGGPGADTFNPNTPIAKIIVIEFVSSQCGSTGEWAVSGYRLRTTAGGIRTFHFLPPGQQFPGRGIVVGSQQTRIYTEPGMDVVLFVDALTTSGPGTALCNVTLSGYFVTP